MFTPRPTPLSAPPPRLELSQLVLSPHRREATVSRPLPSTSPPWPSVTARRLLSLLPAFPRSLSLQKSRPIRLATPLALHLLHCQLAGSPAVFQRATLCRQSLLALRLLFQPVDLPHLFLLAAHLHPSLPAARLSLTLLAAHLLIPPAVHLSLILSAGLPPAPARLAILPLAPILLETQFTFRILPDLPTPAVATTLRRRLRLPTSLALQPAPRLAIPPLPRDLQLPQLVLARLEAAWLPLSRLSEPSWCCKRDSCTWKHVTQSAVVPTRPIWCNVIVI